ncbi:ABC transporter permease [Kosakonia sacchari]|uniref:ABC transporter permease n=1 Tax=Kosakonia sacchari TaxID=1158459 RepID=UPI0008073310|nr:ABC transporter permease [Kosakonia sacchari]ANR80890.1 ABC transporter permease [Kosakonia sacchari]
MVIIYKLYNTLVVNYNLIYQLTKRDILQRYRGSAFGLAWSIINPLIMLALYTFVFSYVFQARWGSGNELPHDMYALVLYTGMILHAQLAECLNRSPGLLQSNTNYVKKVVFPLESLIWVIVGSATFQAAIGFMILIIAKVIITHSLSLNIFYLIPLLFPYILFLSGISWIISAVGVYFKDIIHLTGILTTVLMFASPILYPVSMLPKKFQLIIYFNPLTYFIEEFRNVLIWDNHPNFQNYVIALVLTSTMCILGLFIFDRTKKGFADVI